MKYKIFAILAVATLTAQAQDTYQNDELLGTGDVIGTARYVGMGGAMGALGADMSLMGSNPAGIGLYRRNDISLTAGAIIPVGAGGWKKGSDTYGEGLSKASFDQMGFVWSIRTGTEKMKYLNLGLGYQKRANYNNGFFADHHNLKGMSQMDMMAEFANGNGTDGFDTDCNLAGMAVDNGYLDQDAAGYYNSYNGDYSNTTTRRTGSLQGFDINISGNAKDRVYWGATLGIDNVDFDAWSDYSEYSSKPDGSGGILTGDYCLSRDIKINGWGIKGVFGLLVRPIEDNALRFGVTLETPTYYRLNNSTLFALTDVKSIESYYEFTMRSPMKARFSLGSTVGSNFAWDVEYEFANYGKTKTGVPTYDYDDPNHSSFANKSDMLMNNLTKNTLKGQHILRAGVEYRPASAWAIRMGYNFISSRYKQNIGFDQWTLANGDGRTYSLPMDYATGTDYLRLGASNIITLGVGYKYKKFYVDLAYKARAQKAEYHAFDDITYTGTAWVGSAVENAKLDPVDLKFAHHQLSCTVGFKF